MTPISANKLILTDAAVSQIHGEPDLTHLFIRPVFIRPVFIRWMFVDPVFITLSAPFDSVHAAAGEPLLPAYSPKRKAE